MQSFRQSQWYHRRDRNIHKLYSGPILTIREARKPNGVWENSPIKNPDDLESLLRLGYCWVGVETLDHKLPDLTITEALCLHFTQPA